MKPRLILRADGDSRIGLGHVMRLLALAEIAGPTWHRVFVLREPIEAVRAQISDSIEEVISLPSFVSWSDEADWLATKVLRSDDVLALDGYHFDFDYQARVCEVSGALLYLDDLHTFPQTADVILNPAGGVPESVYDLRQPGARLLIGPQWAPLRAPFREAAKNPPAKPAPVDNVLLCLGGADPMNNTQRLVADLFQIGEIAHLHVAVGAAYRHWESLQAWTAIQHSERLSLYHALSAADFCRLLQTCGSAITAASTVSYEYCSAGGGLLCVIPTADNQRGIYDFLLRQGLARPYHALGNALSAPDVAHIVSNLRAVQQQHFDGKAPARLQTILRSLSAKARLRLRPATWTDSARLLAWANDPLVRGFSYNSTPIQQADHEQWLRDKLADAYHLLLIAEIGGEPAGTIRFALDPNTGIATLSYALAAEARGQGAATPLLLAGSKAARQHWGKALRLILGHVQQTNEASIRAFQRAGFMAVSDPATPDHSVSFMTTA